MKRKTKILTSLLLLMSLLLLTNIVTFAKDSYALDITTTVNEAFTGSADETEVTFNIKNNKTSQIKFTKLELHALSSNGDLGPYEGDIIYDFLAAQSNGVTLNKNQNRPIKYSFNYNTGDKKFGFTNYEVTYKIVYNYKDTDEFSPPKDLTYTFTKTILDTKAIALNWKDDAPGVTPAQTLSKHCKKHITDTYPEGIHIKNIKQYYDQSVAFRNQVFANTALYDYKGTLEHDKYYEKIPKNARYVMSEFFTQKIYSFGTRELSL